jgi:hypothetical protein
MKPLITHHPWGRATVFLFVAGLFLAPTNTRMAVAAPPLNPLPAPAYSFDLASPSTDPSTRKAGDILVLNGNQPVVALSGSTLGMVSANDDLDGLSSNVMLSPTTPFLLLFSVDRQSQGAAPPSHDLAALGIPFNAFDQAERGQAAADEYMATELFNAFGPSPMRGERSTNNSLVRANYDEGGTDFGAVPAVDSYGNAAKGIQDNVDAISRLTHATGGAIVNVYFTLTAASPSLVPLSGGIPPSGATVFFNPDPNSLAPTGVYAFWYELGLTQADDVDALIVFDTNANGHFDGSDRMLFSLAPGSPSLTTILGTSSQGAAADVLLAFPGQPPVVYAPAAALGLGSPLDNIDALDLQPCMDWLACAEQYSIRALKGDLNCDNTVGFADINPFVLALSNPAVYQSAHPGCFISNGDINRDGFVDFRDINPFVAVLSSGGGG